jgi:death-on-curing protein
MAEATHNAFLTYGDPAARDKSLEGPMGRVDKRLTYGLIEDFFVRAAAHCLSVTQGQCFNHGNKRTAFRVVQLALDLSGKPEPPVPPATLGDVVIRIARRQMEETALADWPRERA